MSLDSFVTTRQQALQKDLDEAELELARLEQRREYLTHAVRELRVALNMLGECQLYHEGKHPQYQQPAQEAACPSPNGTVRTPVP